jgi:orotate phosphoribosyltransferase
METYKQEFIEFMVRCEVLRFGSFTTKSGRQTPFFINAGAYGTGGQLAKLAGFYASAIENALGQDFDVLFGPAYKGIPLAVATSIALNQRGHDVGFCFNRKEVKGHGEGGVLVGHPLDHGARVLIIEDVTTAGTSIRETVPLLRQSAEITLAGLVVSVDRQERGTTARSALVELRESFAMPAFAIVTIDEVLAHLHRREVDGRVVLDDERYEAALAYRQRYGADDAAIGQD